MSEVKQHKRWFGIFTGLTVLVLLQIAWWTTAFFQNLAHLEALTSEDFTRRRIMFLSESVFFAAVTCIGLYLLYRALKVEERSREIQRNFIEIVTHESKTPLTAMKLRLESIQAKSGTDPKLASDLGLAIDEVRRLSSIFEKAMSLNRVERDALTFEVISLGEVVTEVARRLDPVLKARKVEISLELDFEALVKGDAHGLQNSVQSLIENAALYNSALQKHVTISVRSEAPRAKLRISDNGPGIPEADRAHLFDRFYRGETGRSVPGTGLGLYIAKTLIEAHHGSIRLVDTGSRGTTFEIDLPLEKV